MALLFEWDKNKASISFKKHTVSFEEATTVFGDVWSITVSDPRCIPPRKIALL